MKSLVFVEKLSYYKYINVDYPEFLLVFLNYIDLGQLGMPNIMKTLLGGDVSVQTSTSKKLRLLESAADAGRDEMILMNSYYDLSYSVIFLETYGGVLFSMLITLFMYALFKIISVCMSSKYIKTKKLINSVLTMFEKNIIITLLVSRYFHLCVGITFNFRYMTLSSTYHIVSFSIGAIYTSLLLMVCITLTCMLIRDERNFSKFTFMVPLFKKVAVLYCDFADPANSRFARFLPLFTLLPNCGMCIIIVMLSNWPLAQLILLASFEIVSIFMHVQKVPFKSNFVKANLVIADVGFLLINICFLAVYSIQDNMSEAILVYKIGLGWTIISIGSGAFILQIIIKLVDMVIRARKNKTAKRKSTKSTLPNNESDLEAKQLQNAKDNNLSSSLDVNHTPFQSIKRILVKPKPAIQYTSNSSSTASEISVGPSSNTELPIKQRISQLNESHDSLVGGESLTSKYKMMLEAKRD